MAVIRVGIIGLSSAASGTSWASSAHLPYLLKSPHYQIVALLNTSVKSASSAIKHYNLPSETKAYGDPQDLANDANVDLVVCSVRVDSHYQTVKPSIIAGKSIFVEWPLEKNLAIAKKMAELAVKHKAKTIVGLQASFDPTVRKLKEYVQGGKLGKLLSSSFVTSLGNGGVTESSKVSYFLDREVGGSIISIHVGHMLEGFASVLGEFASYNSILSNRNPTKNIIDTSTGQIVEKDVPNTVPDQILLQGLVGPSKAPLSAHWRGGPPIPDTPALDWRIQGSLGELRVTSPTGSLNVGREGTKIEFFDLKAGTKEVVEVEKGELDNLPRAAQNIGRVYEAWRLGKWVPEWEWAVKRHEVIDGMWRNYDESSKG